MFNTSSRPSCFVVTTRSFSLVNSRLLLLNNLSSNYDVYAFCSFDNYSKSSSLLSYGLKEIKVCRRFFSPLQDAFSLLVLAYWFFRLRPSLILSFNLKPLILVSFLKLLSPFNSFKLLSTLTGLGRTFTSNKLVTVAAKLFLFFAAKVSDFFVFQNPDDLNFFVEAGLCSDKKSVLVTSSGVNLNTFYPKNDSYKSKDVIMVGRLIEEKGAFDFMELASLLKPRFPNINFKWYGSYEDKDFYDLLLAQGFDNWVEYCGHVSNISEIYSSSHILCFTSFYREGVPRSILEASASGLPVIAYDLPGIREAIQNNSTGFLVEPRQVQKLATALISLLTDKILYDQIAYEGPAFVKKNFSEDRIVDLYLHLCS